MGGVSVFSCGRDVNYYFQRKDYDRLHAKVATKIPQTSVCMSFGNVTLSFLPLEMACISPAHECGQVYAVGA